MGEKELSRRSFARIGAAVLALPALGTLQGLAAPQAYAATNALWTKLDWRMEGYQRERGTSAATRQSTNYRYVVDQLRALTSQEMAGTQGRPGLYDTSVRSHQPRTNRVIQILLWSDDTGASRNDVNLYFSVDDLYLMGFTSRGQHYRFDAGYTHHLADSLGRASSTPPPLVHVMESTGSYATLNADPLWRGEQEYTAHNFLRHLNELRNARPNNMNSNGVTRALAFFIGATSEAARFGGFIQERICNVLIYDEDRSYNDRPAHLGGFGTALQNNWHTLSALAHRNLQGLEAEPVGIDGRHFRNVEDILNGAHGGGPRIAPFIGILGSGV
ncbi:ribosome-inactivating family protein [Streptomyces sp. NPDC006627]|uniref:ribosome-inactivating family protein n=1 Tax=Streptomyces sp. NPDC006627 TaxID=3154679 RepID=UPI0033BCBF2E